MDIDDDTFATLAGRAERPLDEHTLDEHVDEFCFTLALALRRVLNLEPLDAEEEEADDDAE